MIKDRRLRDHEQVSEAFAENGGCDLGIIRPAPKGFGPESEQI
jgi:hypothetical protein